jgi:hypothetical protein
VESLRETVAKGKTLAESAAELKYVSSIYNFLSKLTRQAFFANKYSLELYYFNFVSFDQKA